MNQFIHFISFLLIVLLPGCANQIDYRANLQQAKLCCESYNEIKYQPIDYENKVALRIGDEDTPVRLFNGEKRFFQALSLPPFQGAWQLGISSSPVRQSVFLPNVLLLNDAYQLIKEIPACDFTQENGHASFQLFMNKDEGIRYIIFYSAKSSLGIKNELRTWGASTTPLVAGPALFMFRDGADTKSTITSDEGGHLDVALKKYQPRIITP